MRRRMVSKWPGDPVLDISNLSYAGTAAFGGISLNPAGIHFADNGNYMFYCGNASGDYVYRCDLAEPYVPTTLTSDQSLSISAYSSIKAGVVLSPDGTKMVVGVQRDELLVELEKLHQYTLSTPFDLTTATHNGSKTMSSTGYVLEVLSFNDDGSIIFCGLSDEVHGFDLPTAYDITSGDFSYQDYEYDTNEAGFGARGAIFAEEGKKMLVAMEDVSTEAKVVLYSLSTAWDISTATKLDEAELTADDDVTGIALNDRLSILYAVEGGTDDVKKYTL